QCRRGRHRRPARRDRRRPRGERRGLRPGIRSEGGPVIRTPHGPSGAGAPAAPVMPIPDTSSFTEHLRRHSPELLPGHGHETERSAGTPPTVPHGTTIVALAHSAGVVIAGDRRSTMGNLIASRDIEKVFVTDAYSAVGIAGTAGIAVELVRLFAVELEHYDKIEGMPLTFDGKANRLATMVRGNLGAAMQGLAVV